MAGFSAMQKHLFALRFASKEMLRHSKKCENSEHVDRNKCKKAIKIGNLDCAKIHAENAIRNRNQSVNYLRMSARLEGVSCKVQHAITMRTVTHSMKGAMRAMEAALKTMNLEQISKMMDKFEQQTENMDVQAATLDTTMGNSCTSSIPQEQVNGLLAQIAAEAGLELSLQLPQTQAETVLPSTSASVRGDLTDRLADLRKLN